MIEHHCGDLLGGYVLETLDEAEVERVTAHIRICVWCREEAGIMADCVHDAMGYSVRPATPGAHVRESLLTRLAEERAALGAMALPADEAIGTDADNSDADAAKSTHKNAASTASNTLETPHN